MATSATVISVGAVCFGVVVGWITYRTLRRNREGAAISDIASVLAAIGGAAVTSLYGDGESDAFAWYSMGLLAGFALYFVISWIVGGKQEVSGFMGDGT